MSWYGGGGGTSDAVIDAAAMAADDVPFDDAVDAIESFKFVIWSSWCWRADGGCE